MLTNTDLVGFAGRRPSPAAVAAPVGSTPAVVGGSSCSSPEDFF